MFGRSIARAAVLLLLLHRATLPAHAQATAPAPAPAPFPNASLLRVFLDCQFECDTDYLHQNVAFVDYVRDRAVAELHVLVTTQGTGGGGSAWTLLFIGQGRFQDRDRTLSFNTPQTASADDRRKEFARVFKIGLVWYAADTAALPELDVTWTRPGAIGSALRAKDPWNYWVFRLSGGGNANGEASTKNRSFQFSFSGSRTTDRWKISLSTSADRNQNTFDLGDGEIVKSLSDSARVDTLVVRSLGPRWSIGNQASVSHSTFSNNSRTVTVSPGIEYDVFPYSEWSRRSLTIRYAAGASVYEYRELTIFDKLKETIPNQSLNLSIGLRQPWGSLSASTNLSENLNHPSEYHASVSGNTDVRLFKGFSFNFFGEYERIRDQIGLAKGDASTEDVLLRLRQLPTGYSYFLNFGITYSFGSIFNNTVNPRFGGSGSGF